MVEIFLFYLHLATSSANQHNAEPDVTDDSRDRVEFDIVATNTGLVATSQRYDYSDGED